LAGYETTPYQIVKFELFSRKEWLYGWLRVPAGRFFWVQKL
jgi:hypothetical protein